MSWKQYNVGQCILCGKSVSYEREMEGEPAGLFDQRTPPGEIRTIPSLEAIQLCGCDPKTIEFNVARAKARAEKKSEL